MITRFRFVIVLLAVALFAAACGGSDTATTTDTAEAGDAPAPSTTPDDGPEPTVAVPAAAAPTAQAEPTAAPEPTATPEPEPTATEQPVIPAQIETVSFNDDFATSVEPILAEKCASCHAPGGPGAVHWQIDSVSDLTETHELIRWAVESNYMPPWPASDASIAFRDNRDLRVDQAQAIIDWSEAGAPIDVDPSTPVVPTDLVVGLADPDLNLVPAEPYAGQAGTVDDYRCQIYDPQLPDGGWITGYEFIPDQTQVVHHAIGYVIEADRRDRAEQRDGEDGRPGWECYGSSGLGGDDIFLGWAPGQDASVMPEGSGLWLPPGSFIVVQIHYHYEADAPLDASALALDIADPAEIEAAGGGLDEIVVTELIAPAEIPCAEGETGPLCDRDAAMADAIERFGDEGVQADRFNAICGVKPEDFAQFTDGVVSSGCEIPTFFIDATGELVSVLGHMHEIGDWFRMTLNPGRPDELVLLDIPDWDFDWQYNYSPVDSIVLDEDDTILIECGWDRARRDPALEPAYILWADGTNDEMCFATVTVRK